ncbi:bifunctional biotin--[acetyl-CoA-carboxylase] ligase/biotin operon repressor BirA [Shewanella sedimentimangrovi]|uniref:Bifunctional ligase/repressor BirA n=1 Tax=Shewanella sedimentimangrovi TaxID=2814293 RepID=A0ABX7R112_9GAMM|nr:bifunctional biotin--[acetyl-CoA-carboxylase] ligase/biotin operon repressor BirA [Shewanella sedimentimangrovi]QSX37458.1 bifunctional biotin--[acetyl-CoA-carboxylase] ligase/biotin operon repressor BirA [Shewanella sedimentimangrovi]
MSEHWQRKREILALMAAGDFVSGELLAEKLGISRSAINKHMEGLADYGVSLFSVKGKGYKLASPVSLIDPVRLKQGVGKRSFYFDETDSTNAFMLQHADELESGDLCVAEYQSSGRGRRGRSWVSPYGSHLYFSLFWSLPELSKAMGLSLVAGCALAKVLADLGVEELGLKWPNDLYFQGRKLAGILVEIKGQADGECQLVIGIGVNLAMPTNQAEKIDQPWSDLQSTERVPDKTALTLALHSQLCRDLELFEREGLGAFQSRWSAADEFAGKPVELLMADRRVAGICRGIDEQGALLLETDAGLQSFIGGEISLRAGH